MDNNNHTQWISINDAAKLTGYDEEQVRRLARTGEINAKKPLIGNAWMVDKDSVIEYAKRRGKMQ